MKINRNQSAVLTNKQLLRTENKLSSTMQKLSSGYKINRAGDNPAGLAISNKMKAQIDAVTQAKTNTTDGDSVLSIADGALNEVHSILQRMRELAVQAANGTNSAGEKEAIQDEINQLKKEVDRISTDTEYNEKNLLDGSSDLRVYSKEASRIKTSDAVLPGKYEVTIEEKAEAAKADVNYQLEKDLTTDPDKDATMMDMGILGKDEQAIVRINDVDVVVKSDMTKEEVNNMLRDLFETSNINISDDNKKMTGKHVGLNSRIEISTESEEIAKQIFGMSDAEIEKDADGNPITPIHVAKEEGKDVKLKKELVDADHPEKGETLGKGFSSSARYTVEGNRVKVMDRDGFTMDFLISDKLEADKIVSMEVTDIGEMTLQVGGNQYQTINVRIEEVSSASLYLDEIDVSKTDGAGKAMTILDEAIEMVSDVRARIGACQNRLEHATNSLAETVEDMTSAYSNLLDTDMASEMSEYAQLNVLNQATVSVLAQANELPQQILSLLS